MLLEVLIAALIFTFTVSAAAATAAYHERALQLHQDRNSATFLAEQVMEEVMAGGFSRLPAAAAAYPQDLTIKRGVDGIPVTSVYSCRVVVSSPSDPKLRTVVVEVNYPERQGLRTVHLETDVFWSR